MFKFPKTNILHVLLIFTVSTGLVSTQAPLNKFYRETQTSLSDPIPYESFAFIKIEADIKREICDPFVTDDCFEATVHEMSIQGSGAVIAQDSCHSFVITAAHVCKPDDFMTLLPGVEFDATILVTDYWGNEHEADIIEYDVGHDICLLRTEGNWAAPVPIASDMPEIGEEVYNMAAPRGVFRPGMVPLFTGLYSGTSWSGEEYYTVPVSPGSSGSIILNEDGEVVGILHSAIREFGHIAIASSLESVQELVRTNVYTY